MEVQPYPHQKKAIKNMKRIETEGYGGLLAHEMGLGKTITMALHLKENKLPISDLIVCPYSVIKTWEYELKRVNPVIPKILVYHGDNRDKKLENGPWDYVITTYTILGMGKIHKKFWGRIVLDESHIIRNGKPDTNRGPKCAIAAFKLSSRSRYRWCISGTPFNNRISDIIAQCAFIGTTPYNNKKWWYQNRRNDDKICEWRDRFVLFKSKEGLLEPSKYVEIIVEPRVIESNLIKDLRARAAKEFAMWKKATGLAKAELQMRILGLIIKMRQYANSYYCGEDITDTETLLDNCAKLEQVINDIDDKVYKDSKKGIVVFSQFTSFICILKKVILEQLPGIDVYTFIGDMNSTKRDQVVRIFNKSREPRVILVSLIAGGTGLSLHYGSSTVLMCEPCYNPFAEKQAEERVHRLGQDTQVNIYKYRLTEGVENWMEGLKKKKLKIASTLGMTKKNLVSDDFAFSEVERLFSEHVSFTG
jgi:SNF2 family DNA or RNA helicase